MAFPLCAGDQRNARAALKGDLKQGPKASCQVLPQGQSKGSIGMFSFRVRFEVRGGTGRLHAWQPISQLNIAKPLHVIVLDTNHRIVLEDGNGPLAYVPDSTLSHDNEGMNRMIPTPSASESSPEDDEDEDDADDEDDEDDDWEGGLEPDIEEWDRK